MFKFFRHIRQRLLSENKVRNYLLYAIGEIALVIVGILIAIQVNNWNEQRKNRELVTRTIDALETELEENFNHANFVLGFWKTQDSICKKVLFDQLTIDDYRKNDLVSIVAVNWYNFLPKVENLNLLLENEKSASARLKPIIESAKYLKDRNMILDQQWDILRMNIEENLKSLTGTVSLVRFDSTSVNNKIQYMLNDPQYKNVVELYWIKAEVYYDFISRCRAQIMALLSTIKVVQKDYDIHQLKALYQKYNMHSFMPLDCSQHQYEKNDEIRRSYLIGNLTDEPITIRMINDGKVGGVYQLKPKQFTSTRPEYAGVGGDYTVIAEQMDEYGNCLQKFIAVTKGYLIIN